MVRPPELFPAYNLIETKVSWDQLPVLDSEPEFYEITEIRELAATIFALLSVTFSGIGVYAYLYFTATIALKLAVVAVIMALASATIFCLEPSRNDPEQRQKLRYEARGQIEFNRLGYQSIAVIYERDIVSVEDINILFANDLLNLEIPKILEKLAHNKRDVKKQGIEILEILNENNRNALARKFYDHYRILHLGSRQLNFAINFDFPNSIILNDAQYRHLMLEEVQQEINGLIANKMTYEEFVSRNGFEQIELAFQENSELKQEFCDYIVSLPPSQTKQLRLHDAPLMGISQNEFGPALDRRLVIVKSQKFVIPREIMNPFPLPDAIFAKFLRKMAKQSQKIEKQQSHKRLTSLTL